jgi:hypothetical protein
MTATPNRRWSQRGERGMILGRVPQLEVRRTSASRMDETIKITHGNGLFTEIPARDIGGTSFVRGRDEYHFLVFSRIASLEDLTVWLEGRCRRSAPAH